MVADAFLSDLAKVKRVGPGRWMACCPAHEDKRPSLSIKETSDERVLIHCFGGCPVEDVLAAVGRTFDDLYPPRPPLEGHRIQRKPWIPQDVFELARHEIAVVAIIACDLNKNLAISAEDLNRILVAWGRLDDIAQSAYHR